MERGPYSQLYVAPEDVLDSSAVVVGRAVALNGEKRQLYCLICRSRSALVVGRAMALDQEKKRQL